MRRAYQEVGWLVHEEQGEPFGFSLGFDFCAEHEFGARYIKSALGIAQKDIPVGVEDRTATCVPSQLELFEYEHRSRDKRYKKSMPAALLHCSDTFRFSDAPESMAEIARRLDVGFDVDFAADKRWYDAAKHDIVSAWSAHSGFAIHVRGEENVRKLKRLHDAMQRCAVSVADAALVGFKRKALALVLNECLSEELKAEVRERDEAFLRLHQAADATGIEKLLTEAGKRWYALSPAWRDGEGSELLFFLNPCEQKKYAHGWFTVEELKQWAADRGPVAHSNAIAAPLKEQDPDWGIHLHRGLEDNGVRLRVFESFQWMDDKHTVPGARLLVSAATRDKMSDGIYPLSELEQFVQRGREQREQEKAASAAKEAAAT